MIGHWLCSAGLLAFNAVLIARFPFPILLLGPLLRLSPSLSLEPRILNAFRLRLEQGVRQLLTIGVDLERGTASVGSRPVSSVEREEQSEDPLFDRTALRMLAAFDARRVAPVLIS